MNQRAFFSRPVVVVLALFAASVLLATRRDLDQPRADKDGAPFTAWKRVSERPILSPQDDGWESAGTFNPAVIFVADEGSVLVGCVEAADQDGIAYIGLLTVEPSRQGGGLGRRLAEAAEAFARGRGLTMAKMTVIAIRSELIAWYERLGYKRTGSCAAFPAHDPRFGTPLRTDLEFVVLEKTL